VPAPELTVVCRSCGSEVSPYVTECPYCGHRLRKRAPKLEREGDEIRVRETRRDRRRRLRSERAAERSLEFDFATRPYATMATLLIGALTIVLGAAIPLDLDQLGAVIGPAGDEPWRYVTASFVYDDVGAFAVVAFAIGIFGASVERRLGTLATVTLLLATGTLGMLAAGAAQSAGLTDTVLAYGGNGVALGLLGAWLMLWRAESRTGLAEPLETIGLAVAAAVLLLIPLAERGFDPIAGIVGGLVGLAMGGLAARRGGVA
jgi:membrane associated rhomboid family serine protease